MASALLGLGLVDLAENKPEAREHIAASLRLNVEANLQRYQLSSLVGMAGLALGAGDAAEAARWLGAGAAALKALGVVMESSMLHFHAQTLVAVREQVSEATFQSAWEEGSQWLLEEAVKKALGEAT